jgi:hypothetical protein
MVWVLILRLIIHNLRVECRQVSLKVTVTRISFCKFVKIYNMVIRFNAATQEKIEKIIEESGYLIRFERGTFQSGYCILESKKVVVLNKFLQIEGRINTLMDLIPSLKIVPESLTPESRKLYEEIMGKLAVEDKDA